MAICTYYSDNERSQMTTTSDEDINKLLQEVNAMGGKYLIKERFVTPRREFFTSWFKTLKPRPLYSLYIHISGTECQCINFCQEHDWSINTHVTKSYIITYFYGVINGARLKTNPQQ